MTVILFTIVKSYLTGGVMSSDGRKPIVLSDYPNSIPSHLVWWWWWTIVNTPAGLDYTEYQKLAKTHVMNTTKVQTWALLHTVQDQTAMTPGRLINGAGWKHFPFMISSAHTETTVHEAICLCYSMDAGTANHYHTHTPVALLPTHFFFAFTCM